MNRYYITAELNSNSLWDGLTGDHIKTISTSPKECTREAIDERNRTIRALVIECRELNDKDRAEYRQFGESKKEFEARTKGV